MSNPLPFWCESTLTKLLLTFFMAIPISAQSIWKANWNLEQNWTRQNIPGVKTSTQFSVLAAQGEDPLRLGVFVAQSASGLVSRESFKLGKNNILKFKSRINNIFPHDPHTKKGDDSPLKITLMFEYDPKLASLSDRFMWALLKQKFGSYPPIKTLSFTWVGNDLLTQPYPSPYTDRVWHVPIGHKKDLNQWSDYQFDLDSICLNIFGSKPQEKFRIGIFADGDNGSLTSKAEIANINLNLYP
jgi:hypothetical protein